MTLSREEVFHLAELARIELRPEEADRFCEQMQAILAYVERLATIDTSSVSYSELNLNEVVLAADIAFPISPVEREALIQAFPDHLGQLLRVPGVFEHPKKS